jgi:5-methylcytosine-specific restriction endonuclease McrA
MLKGYGFRGERSKDDLQIDHIHELQLGGQDNYRNLWPLASSANGSAGSTIDNYLVTLKSGKTPKLYQLREYVAKTNRQIYFAVQSVR